MPRRTRTGSRSYPTSIRLTALERVQVEALAEAAGLTVSAWIRARVLETP